MGKRGIVALMSMARLATIASLAALVITSATSARAHETDQFTPPPPRPFAELGPYFTQLFYEKISAAVDQTNSRIRRCRDSGRSPAELRRLQSPDTIARAVCCQFGLAGIYIGDLERLVHSPQLKHRFPGLTVAHRPTPCIYDHAIFPLDPRRFYLLWRSSVIMINGTYVSTDKIGHFIHHGYNYFVGYRDALARGGDRAEAFRRAVALGAGDHFFFSERRLLGMLTSGVISNADLAANYVGLLFYINLTEEVSVQGRPRPPMLTRAGDFWQISPGVNPRSGFLVEFFTDHLDEALNPNCYDAITAEALRRIIRPYCDALSLWYADENGEPPPHQYFQDRMRELSHYYGADYGHIGDSDALVGIATVCACEDATGAGDAARLLSAVRAGDVVAVERLLPAGVDVNAVPPRTQNAPYTWGETALHVAIRNDRPELVDLLLRYGADPNASTDRGVTALHLASGSAALTARLLRAGADVVACDRLGRSALHWAARSGRPEPARLLIESGADIDAADCDRETPLHAAVRAGRRQVVELLLAHGANVNATAMYEATPLHIAVQQRHLGIAHSLIDRGARVDSPDEFGCTPLHDAVAAGDAALLRLLIAHGADTDASDCYGTTPLHLAARAGRMDLVDCLLLNGTCPVTRAHNGHTPRAEARLGNHQAVAGRLRDAERRAAARSTPASLSATRPERAPE